MNAPIIINRTANDAAAFNKTQKRIQKNTGMGVQEQANLMFEYGCYFAEWFASLFGVKNEKRIYYMLLTTPPQIGEPNNKYWMWWRLKWLQDDEQYNKECTHINYYQYKSYFFKNELLEQELLNMFNDNFF